MPLLLYSHRCVILCRIIWRYGVEVVLYISGVGLSALLVFDCDGHVERPQNVKRATVQGFTLFYVLLRWKLTAE